MSELRPEEEDALLARVGRVLDSLEPVPGFVTDAASVAYSWRSVDAELAELLSDTAVQAGELAVARGPGTGARSVTFASRRLSISIELRGDDAHVTLLGQLSPPAARAVSLDAVDRTSATTVQSNELGLFRFELARGSVIRLRVADGSGEGAESVATSWIGI